GRGKAAVRAIERRPFRFEAAKKTLGVRTPPTMAATVRQATLISSPFLIRCLPRTARADAPWLRGYIHEPHDCSHHQWQALFGRSRAAAPSHPLPARGGGIYRPAHRL